MDKCFYERDRWWLDRAELERVGRAGAEALVPYVNENTRLRMLMLPQTKLGADGMQVLADALETNATLTALDVSGNQIATDGKGGIIDALGPLQ